jgi:hypothetical protein
MRHGRPLRAVENGEQDWWTRTASMLGEILAAQSAADRQKPELAAAYARVDALKAEAGWQPSWSRGEMVSHAVLAGWEMRECKWCGDDFAVIRSSDQRCCSRGCGQDYRRWSEERARPPRLLPRMKPCEWCQVEFQPHGRWIERFCSPFCSGSYGHSCRKVKEEPPTPRAEAVSEWERALVRMNASRREAAS